MANLIFSTGGSAPGDTYSNTVGQLTALGTKAYTEDGRCFRYCVVGATATVAGSLYQSAAPVPNHLGRAAPATAIGATSFTFTPGATAGVAQLYAEGYLQVSTTPGLGYTYQVASNGTIGSSTAFTVTLQDAIQIALTTDSKVGLIHNRWKNVIVAPTTLTASVAGVAGCVITAVQYGWLQTGRCSVLINGTPAVTAPVINSATTAGALDVWTTAAQATAALVGHMCQVGVSTECNFVDLEIDS